MWIVPFRRVLGEHRPEYAFLCHTEESQISLKKLNQGIQSKKTLRYYKFYDGGSLGAAQVCLLDTVHHHA
jgi:hypothetical protein